MLPHFPVPDRPRPRQFQIRSLMLVVACSALAAWVARDPVLRGVAVMLVASVALPVVILLVLMSLGAIGFAVWAAVEWVAGWVRRSASFPDDAPGA